MNLNDENVKAISDHWLYGATTCPNGLARNRKLKHIDFRILFIILSKENYKSEESRYFSLSYLESILESSKNTIRASLNRLVKNNFVNQISPGKPNEPAKYEINIEVNVCYKHKKIKKEKNPPANDSASTVKTKAKGVSKIDTVGVSKIDTGGVSKIDTKEINIKRNKYKSSSPLRGCIDSLKGNELTEKRLKNIKCKTQEGWIKEYGLGYVRECLQKAFEWEMHKDGPKVKNVSLFVANWLKRQKQINAKSNVEKPKQLKLCDYPKEFQKWFEDKQFDNYREEYSSDLKKLASLYQIYKGKLK